MHGFMAVLWLEITASQWVAWTVPALRELPGARSPLTCHQICTLPEPDGTTAAADGSDLLACDTAGASEPAAL